MGERPSTLEHQRALRAGRRAVFSASRLCLDEVRSDGGGDPRASCRNNTAYASEGEVRKGSLLAGLAAYRGKVIDPASAQVLTTLIRAFGTLAVEKVHLILTDGEGRYLHDEALASGQLTRVQARFRDVISRALSREASGIILVHNHPSGDPTPSRADVMRSHDLRSIAKTLDIVLVDHIVIGRTSACSMRRAGLL